MNTSAINSKQWVKTIEFSRGEFLRQPKTAPLLKISESAPAAIASNFKWITMFWNTTILWLHVGPMHIYDYLILLINM